MSILSKIIRPMFYTASYGIVFPTFLVVHMVPGLGPVAEGLIDRITTALRAAKVEEDDLEKRLVLEEGVEVLAACCR